MKKFLALLFTALFLALPACASADGMAGDGQYTIGVTLAGGSGRAAVESPAVLSVSDGAMTAQIVWSSPNYDYMLIDGTYYYPINTEGNSTFEIPVAALDSEIALSAETTAMSEPHVIDYTLYFDSSTVKTASGGAVPVVIVIAAAAIAAAVSAAVYFGRKHKRESGNE
jgi:Tfp pilus assembly protein PilW